MDIIGGLIGIVVVGGILLYFKIAQTDYEIKSKPRSTYVTYDLLKAGREKEGDDPEYMKMYCEELDKRFYNKYLDGEKNYNP